MTEQDIKEWAYLKTQVTLAYCKLDDALTEHDASWAQECIRSAENILDTFERVRGL